MATVLENDDAKRFIAENVRTLLAKHDPPWTQADLARAADESPMTISHLIRGNRLPSAALLHRVAEALGTTTDALLTPPAETISGKSR